MDEEFITKYLDLYDRAGEDPYYHSLMEELAAANPRILRALEEMAPVHRDAVLNYLGVVFAANAKLLELSLLVAEKS